MSIQGLLVLGAAAVAVLFFGRRLMKNLARKGKNADCGCGDGGGCCKARRKA